MSPPYSLGKVTKVPFVYSRYTGWDANSMGIVMLMGPFLHCTAVFLLSAATVRDFLSLAPSEIPKENGKTWRTKRTWRELGWQNRLRLVYLRLIHCLTTGLVPWVLRFGTAS